MNNKKITNAGYRVIELLKELAQKPLSPAELLNIIEEKTDNTYRKEVINKYLNTLKLLNISIQKIENKYCLQKSIEKIDFNTNDIAIIKFIEDYSSKTLSIEIQETLSDCLHTVEKSFSDKTIDLIKAKQHKVYQPSFKMSLRNKSINTYEKYCKDKFKLELRYKEKNKIELYKIAPLKIIYKKSKAILLGYCYSTNAYKEFVINNIIESRQLPQIYGTNSSTSVTFKLKNRLALSYKLKEGETIIERGKDFIVVSNNLEDKDLIIRRLLRYYDSCEILYPKAIKEKLLSLIDEMEQLYV